MARDLTENIELRYTMRMPSKSWMFASMPGKLFASLCLFFLFWMTQEYQIMDRGYIVLGFVVLAATTFVYIQQLRPLVLFGNGDIKVPSSHSLRSKYIYKSKIAAYATLRYSAIALLSSKHKVLAVVRPESFQDTKIFDDWFRSHHGGLKEVPLKKERRFSLRPRFKKGESFGSPMFYFVCLLLVITVGSNIYMTIQNV